MDAVASNLPWFEILLFIGCALASIAILFDDHISRFEETALVGCGIVLIARSLLLASTLILAAPGRSLLVDAASEVHERSATGAALADRQAGIHGRGR